MKHSIAIVDRNKAFREELAEMIAKVPSFSLEKIYTSAEEAMEMGNKPLDYALVDLSLPGMSGLDLIKYLKGRSLTECIVCSMNDDDASILQALQNGAAGYLLKDASMEEIRDALLGMLDGGVPISPFIARRMISFFHKPETNEKENSSSLSRREFMVIQHLSMGLKYREIGERLFISRETVKKHVKSIYQKLDVQNKVAAVNKFKGY